MDAVTLTILSYIIVGAVVIFIIKKTRSPASKVMNKNLTDKQRYEALGKITNQKQLAKLALKSTWISLAKTVTERINDPTLLSKIAREALDGHTRLAAFEKAGELLSDKDLCDKNVKYLLTSYAFQDHADTLLRIAQAHPDIIRKHWKSMQKRSHADSATGYHGDMGTKFTHVDRMSGWNTHIDNRSSRSNDCAHYDHSDTYSHKDVADQYGILKRFPPAILQEGSE